MQHPSMYLKINKDKKLEAFQKYKQKIREN